jgi:hypothetical protein
MMLGIAAEQMAIRAVLYEKGITNETEFQRQVKRASDRLSADPGVQRMLDRVRLLDSSTGPQNTEQSIFLRFS